MPLDLKLDPVTKDLVFVGGALQVVTEFAERARQRIELALSVIRGEFLLDRTRGTAWTDVLGRKTTPAAVEAVARQTILADPDVVSATVSAVIRPDRVASISARATLTSGEVVEVSVVV